jgi:hypothetical protein
VTLGSTSAAAFALAGEIEYLYVWNRAITQAEVLWLYEQPYVFFRAPMWRRDYFGITAANISSVVVIGIDLAQRVRVTERVGQSIRVDICLD